MEKAAVIIEREIQWLQQLLLLMCVQWATDHCFLVGQDLGD